MKILYFVALLALLPSAFAVTALFDDYALVSDSTNIQSCIVPYVNGQDLGFRVAVNLDEPEEVTRRYCPGGLAMAVPYDRHLWVKDTDLNALTGAYSEIAFLSFSNYVEWIDVFEPTTRDAPSIDLARVQFVPSWSTNYVREANEHVKYDITRNNKFGVSVAPLWYSLGRGDVGGGQFYTPSTGAFASAADFASADLGYPVEDLSNPSELARNGRNCGVYKCVSTSELDVDVVNDAGAAFFAFSDALNYYYLPYYVQSLDYVVKAYNGSSEVYSREGSIASTSTDVFFPETYSPGYIPRTRIDDNFFDYGTRISFDGIVASVPSSTSFVNITFKMVLYRNPLYRHRSPADASWYSANVTETLAVSGLSDVKLSWSKSFNLSTFVQNITYSSLDNSSAVNDYDTSADDGAGPVIPGGSVNTNSSLGVDWARDPNSGGGLQGQYEYARGVMTAEDKDGFFEGLAAIQDAIFRILLAVYLIAALFVSVYAFFLLIPSAYRKLIDAVKRLGAF